MFSLVLPVMPLCVPSCFSIQALQQSALRQVSKSLLPMMLIANPEHTYLQAEQLPSWMVTGNCRNVQTDIIFTWVASLFDKPISQIDFALPIEAILYL